MILVNTVDVSSLNLEEIRNLITFKWNPEYQIPKTNGSECTLDNKIIFGNCIVTKDLRIAFDQSASEYIFTKIKM